MFVKILKMKYFKIKYFLLLLNIYKNLKQNLYMKF